MFCSKYTQKYPKTKLGFNDFDLLYKLLWSHDSIASYWKADNNIYRDATSRSSLYLSKQFSQPLYRYISKLIKNWTLSTSQSKRLVRRSHSRLKITNHFVFGINFSFVAPIPSLWAILLSQKLDDSNYECLLVSLSFGSLISPPNFIAYHDDKNYLTSF